MILYCLTNLVTGKRYVGVTTTSLRARWKSHIGFARRHVTNTILAKAIRKYGPGAFALEEMDRLPLGSTLDQLFALEREAIKREGTKAPAGYNLTDGGDGTIGYKFTDEQRAKIRGRRHTAETRQKMSVARKGYRQTAEAKAKIGAAASLRNKGRVVLSLRGKKLTEEHKVALRAGWARRKETLSKMEIH